MELAATPEENNDFVVIGMKGLELATVLSNRLPLVFIFKVLLVTELLGPFETICCSLGVEDNLLPPPKGKLNLKPPTSGAVVVLEVLTEVFSGLMTLDEDNSSDLLKVNTGVDTAVAVVVISELDALELTEILVVGCKANIPSDTDDLKSGFEGIVVLVEKEELGTFKGKTSLSDDILVVLLMLFRGTVVLILFVIDLK